MKRLLLATVLLGAALLPVLLSGCGGPSDPITIALHSEASLDGDTYKCHTDPPGYNSHADRGYINVGHEATFGPPDYHVSIRCLVSFDISSLPAGATIQTATLRMYKIGGNGDESAYTALGNLLLDHVIYAAFSSDLYEQPALDTLATPFATSCMPNGTWQELDVAALVQNDLIAARGHSQFRLRFAKEVPDDADDYSSYYENWSSAETAAPDNPRPELVVTYLP